MLEVQAQEQGLCVKKISQELDKVDNQYPQRLILKCMKSLCHHHHYLAMIIFASGSKCGLKLFFLFKYLYVLCLVLWENPN